jgi:transposase InsO family protein
LDDPSITENLQLYIPEGQVTDDDPITDLRTIIIKSSHQVVGHQGADKSYMHCQKCFYWPNMKKDFDQYVQECMLRLRNKDSTGKPIGDPKIPEITLEPWESIAIDFLGPFNVSNGYQNIMVVMDRFSSAIILVPLRNKFTTRDVANAFLKEVYATHGLPASILSDRDARFTSKFWQGLHDQLGIDLLMSTSFHQNTNGQVERANHTIGQMLRIFTSNDQNE